MVGMRFGRQSFRQVTNGEGMMMNVSQFFRLHRVGEFLTVLVDFFQNSVNRVEDFDLFATFLVLLVFLSEGGLIGG